MRTNAKKISVPAKEKKQPAKTKAKRSKQSLLQSAPAAPEPVIVTADSRGQRWLVGLIVLALVAAAIALVVSSDSFRSRAVTQQPAPASVAAVNDQSQPAAPAVTVVQPVRVEANPDIDARNDYMLALTAGTTEAIDLFLSRYPSGFHADLARVQRKQFADFEQQGVVRLLNAELKRAGCGTPGSVEWTNGSQQALAAFNRHAHTAFDVKSPDAAALKAVKERTDRVCPAPQPAKSADTTTQKQKRGFFFWE
jgi:hypothetical protein